MDTTAPAVNSPKAANIDHTYASRPKPIGCRVSRPRSERRSAMSRKISLPASAQEWAASASIDAEPVMKAATDLATAISRLAPKAITTVSMAEPYPAARTGSASFLPGSTQATARPEFDDGPTSHRTMRRSDDVAAGKKTVVAVASACSLWPPGSGSPASPRPIRPQPRPRRPRERPSAGVDRPGPGHGGPGRGAHDRLDGDLAAKLAEKLGVTEDKVDHGAEGDPRRQQA